mmetsp:Transcript_20822/g.51286  ORF Transcript_20822/g.51286 Transcript_20822/m.51286 type:complete len:305 (-) Transcript_20822:1015-1929(-)
MFVVSALGSPEAEPREASVAALGTLNLFGSNIATEDFAALKKMEAEAIDTLFVFISHFHLDNPQVLLAFQEILAGFEEDDCIPAVFVLHGDFLSRPFGHGSNDYVTLRTLFGELGDLVARHPRICAESRFVLVPGPSDPGPGNFLPRPALPASIVEPFVRKVSRVSPMSNPCRLRFGTQELVVFRHDLLRRMSRNCMIAEESAGGAGGRARQAAAVHAMVKTVMDQAHLCPLPMAAVPRLWAHDHALWLFPLPSFLFLADEVDPYVTSYRGAKACNPGPFPDEFGFQVYYPATGKAEYSQVVLE